MKAPWHIITSHQIIANDILNNITLLEAHRGAQLYLGVADTWERVSRTLGPVVLFLYQETAKGRSPQGLVPVPGEAG